MPTVWLQLVVGEAEYSISLFLNVNCVIDKLKNVVKKECARFLKHVSSAQLDVYPPGTTVPVPSETDPCPLESYVREYSTTSKRRYIVVAPSQQQSSPDIGELQAKVEDTEIENECGESQPAEEGE